MSSLCFNNNEKEPKRIWSVIVGDDTSYMYMYTLLHEEFSIHDITEQQLITK